MCRPGDTNSEVAGVTVCYRQRAWGKAFNSRSHRANFGKALHLWDWAVGILIKPPALSDGVPSHPLGCRDVQCGLHPSVGLCHKICRAGVHARGCSPAGQQMFVSSHETAGPCGCTLREQQLQAHSSWLARRSRTFRSMLHRLLASKLKLAEQ